MKKILIGTHNRGKFKEIAHLISKKYKKISPVTLKIKSPKETGKTFSANSKIKVKFFSKFVFLVLLIEFLLLFYFKLLNLTKLESSIESFSFINNELFCVQLLKLVIYIV